MHKRFSQRNEGLKRQRIDKALGDELAVLGSLADLLERNLKTKPLQVVGNMDLIEYTEILKAMKKNCDGCAANMPVKENTMLGKTVKMHVNEKGQTHMICTAKRYDGKQ